MNGNDRITFDANTRIEKAGLDGDLCVGMM